MKTPTCAPEDVVSYLLESAWDDGNGGFRYEARYNPESHRDPCRVYWGSHGCARPRGHDGDHWCDCCECPPGTHPFPEGPGFECVAGPPYYGPGTKFSGEDA